MGRVDGLDKGKDMIRIDTAYCLNDITYFIGMTDHILYKMNNDNQITYLCFLPNDNDAPIGAYRACVVDGGKIYCMPTHANDLCIFDISTRKLTRIRIRKDENEPLIEQGWIIYGKLWMLSRNYKQIICIDITEEKIVGEYDLCSDDESIGLFADSYDGMIYIPISSNDNIIVFNAKSQNIERIKTGINEIGIGTISCVDNNSIVLSGFKNAIYHYNLIDGSITTTGVIEEAFEKCDNGKFPMFHSSIKFENRIVFSPYNTEYVLSDNLFVFNIDNKSINQVIIKAQKKRENGNQFFIWKINDTMVGILDSIDESFYILRNQLVEKRTVKRNPTDNARFWKENSFSGMAYESIILGLEDFIVGIQ